jgi:hypothetical protein
MFNPAFNVAFSRECLLCVHSFLSLSAWLWWACSCPVLMLRLACSAMARDAESLTYRSPSRERWSRRLHLAAVAIAVAMTALVVIGALATPATANDLNAADLSLIAEPITPTYAAANPATDTNPSGLFGGFSADSAAGNPDRPRTRAYTATLRQEPADYANQSQASPSPAQSKTLAPDLALARDYQDYAHLYREYLDSLERSNQLKQRAATRVVNYAPSYQASYAPAMDCSDGSCSLSYGSGRSSGCSSGNCVQGYGGSYGGSYSSGGCSSGGCSSGGCSGSSCGVGFGRMFSGFRGGGCSSCR